MNHMIPNKTIVYAMKLEGRQYWRHYRGAIRVVITVIHFSMYSTQQKFVPVGHGLTQTSVKKRCTYLKVN